jgi:hypothetical protein
MNQRRRQPTKIRTQKVLQVDRVGTLAGKPCIDNYQELVVTRAPARDQQRFR